MTLACLIACGAAAQEGPTVEEMAALDYADLSLQQLMDIKLDSVYGASKFDQKVSDAPASVSIVTAHEIQKLGHRTLADVLRGIGGLYVTYDRNYSNFGIRGFNRPGDFNTRVLLLVDGHRMNDNLYSSALIGTEAIVDVDLIERVEVIRGPSSSIYGNSAFFGVINVVTRKASQINGTEMAYAAGSFESHRGRFTYGKSFENGLELVLSGSAFTSDGQERLYFPEFNTPATNNGTAEGIDAEYAQSLFGSLSYGDFVLTAAWAQREKQVPTASFGTVFNDQREKTLDERVFVNLKYSHVFENDMELMARAFYDRYSYTANYPFSFGGPSFISEDDHYGEGIGTELQLTQTFLERYTVIVGGEFRHNLNLFQSSFTTNPTVYGFRDNRESSSLGIYSQVEARVREDLLLNAGLRYDYFDNFGGTVNPRLGLIYNPWEKSTFKVLYGQAYRAPNAYELYLESPGFSKANPSLQPETIRTYEVVYEQFLPHNLRLNVSGYYYDIEDLISQGLDASDGLFVFNNVNSVIAKGVEVELEGRHESGLVARGSYALQRAEDAQTGQVLSNSPRHLAKINLIVPLYREKLFGGLELQYTSGLNTLAGSPTSGYLIANATLFSRQLMQNVEVSATIYNLFNTSYSHPGSTGHFQNSIPQDGRSFRVKVSYKF